MRNSLRCFFVEELLSITMKLLKKLIILIALVIVYVFSNAVSIYIYSFAKFMKNVATRSLNLT